MSFSVQIQTNIDHHIPIVRADRLLSKDSQLPACIAFSLTYTVAGFLARGRIATACSGTWVNEAINCLTLGTPRPVTRS
jgi:hypothetical protein